MATPAQLSKQQTTITFIGAGNMARSLLAGLTRDKHDRVLRVTDTSQAQLDIIRSHFPDVETGTNNSQAVRDADMVVLAVKPQVMQAVVESLRGSVSSKTLLLSIAAGVRVDALQQWLQQERIAIVRCMPNTPSLVQTGASGLYANAHTSAAQRDLAESLLRTVGVALWFAQEQQLDTVTAVSGSGPAYFFLVMEAMISAAKAQGLKEEDAHLLVVQTALGAARLALESQDKPEVLRRNVTSKGGTTAAALDTLQAGGLEALFAEAMLAAQQRSIELANLK